MYNIHAFDSENVETLQMEELERYILSKVALH